MTSWIIISVLWLLVDMMMIKEYPPSPNCEHSVLIFLIWVIFGPIIAFGTLLLVIIGLLDGNLFDDDDKGDFI